MKLTRIIVGLSALMAASPALSAELTVWADATRQPAVEAFQAAHPEITVNLIVDDGSSGASGTFQTKIGLADQAGEGWPDVVFSTQNNDAAWASKETNGVQAFAQVLNEGFLDQAFLDGFTPGALDPVTVDGKVYGLRNDLAPVLFWYNKALLDQFGYAPPATWEDYQALGDKLAADHPGYFLGAIGDSFEGPYVYYWSGEAPIFQVDGDTFKSDTAAANTVKVNNLIDHMVANKTLTLDSLFGAAFVATADHLVAIPGAAWYAGALFQNPGGVNAKAGDWVAAPPLYWTDGAKVTGNVGGGVWYASSHTANADAVKVFLQFIVSDEKTAGTGGLPAYKSAADKWLDAQASSGFYAGDFKAAISAAAASVWSGWGYPNFSPETAWAKVITPGLASGKTMADLAADWQQEMKNEAQVVGYTVE
ncbi:MAG: carbohydrate ABC transporter substrate-binding protein [Devosia nanyangense]|uniref:Carbohydrate ABC transporter substrate-binding protein n=1 Tax=Devosia nanyangense TaxID=1228055 RepID=A0A933L290_9HYPH|nr:carbohydrate ABC transporter substrate-binding protein [Devosia nanyangense]